MVVPQLTAGVLGKLFAFLGTFDAQFKLLLLDDVFCCESFCHTCPDDSLIGGRLANAET